MLLFWNVSLSYLPMSKKFILSVNIQSRKPSSYLRYVRVRPCFQATRKLAVLAAAGRRAREARADRAVAAARLLPGTAAARWGREKPAGLFHWDPARSSPSGFSVSQVWFGSVRGTRRDPSHLSGATSCEPGARLIPCPKKRQQQRALGRQHPPLQPVLLPLRSAKNTTVPRGTNNGARFSLGNPCQCSTVGNIS